MMTHLTKSSYMKIVLVCLLCLTICGTLVGGFGCVRNFANFDTENFTLNLASGAVAYEGEIHGALNSDQASGSAVFDLKSNDPRSAALSLASGEMKLMLPEPGFSVTLDKMSGNFSSDYELFSNGNVFYSKADGEGVDALGADDAATKISMNMMSGNFVIGRS